MLDINSPLGPDTVTVTGPTTVEVETFNLADLDGDTREQIPNADLNGDGRVDFADLAILKSMFFGPPGPSGLVP